MSPAVFAHGHFRLYLLRLLAESPMHGYEIILALEEKFGGTYTPSAGTIYPRLAKLEAEGLVTKSSEGRKTIYQITDAGLEELHSREPELEEIEDDLTDSVRRLADEVRQSVNQAMKSLRADLATAAREARAEARETVRKVRVEVQQESSRNLRDLDILLNDFRHQVRSELRSKAARGEGISEPLNTLTQRLKELLAEIL